MDAAADNFLDYQGGSGGPNTSFPNLSTGTRETPTKDETSEAVGEAEDLAGLDTASTALVVYSGNGQFNGSTCRDSYCSQPATGESPYCRLRAYRLTSRPLYL